MYSSDMWVADKQYTTEAQGCMTEKSVIRKQLYKEIQPSCETCGK